MRIIVITPQKREIGNLFKKQPESKKLVLEVYSGLEKGLEKASVNPPEGLFIHDKVISKPADIKKVSSWTRRIPLVLISEYSNEKILLKYKNLDVLDYVYLPLWPGALGEIIKNIESFWKMAGPRKAMGEVLVVDDDTGVRETSCLILSEEGYSTDEASDGTTAVQMVRKKDYDLIISDIRMEGISGLETLRRIKKLKPQIPVVVFTAYADTDTAIEAIQAGASDYIKKPFRIDNFLDMVRRTIKVKKLMDDNLRLMKMQQEDKHALRRRHYEIAVINDFSRRSEAITDELNLTNKLFESLCRIIDYDVIGLLLAGDFRKFFYHLPWELTTEKQNQIIQTIVRNEPSLLGSFSFDELSVEFIGEQETEAAPGRINVEYTVLLGLEKKPLGALYLGRKNKKRYAEVEKNLINSISVIYGHLLDKLQVMRAREQVQLKAVVAGMTNGIIVSDVHNNILVMNQAAKDMISVRRASDPRTLDSLENERGCPISQLIGKMIQEKKNSLTSEVYIKEPKEIILNCNVTEVCDENGEKIGYVSLLQDITELKEIDRMKSEFVSVVSHEMRTPLTTMKNSVNIIMKEAAGAINDAQRRFLKMTDDSIDRLTRLIGSLLDLSKIESGKISLNLEEIDIPIIIERVVKTLMTLADEKNISLVKKKRGKTYPVFADIDRMEQVITNIVHNAIKYSHQGDTIEIIYGKGNYKDLPDICRSRCDEDMLFMEVGVRDYGAGISPEFQEAIFDKFQQAESTLKREMGGIGLGLAICRGIIEAHHGALWVESEMGKGSYFRIFLPKDKRKETLKGDS